MGGTERQVAVLVRGIVARHPDCSPRLHLVALAGGEIEEAVAECGVSVHVLGTGRPTLATAWRFGRTLRSLDPSVVYSLLSPANFLSSLARPFLRRPVRLVWGIRSQSPGLGTSRLRPGIARFLARVLSRNCDLVIVNSHAAARYARRIGIRDKKIQMIPNGIDTTQFKPDRESRDSTRRSLQIADSTRLVICLARFVPDKDHVTLLNAVHRVAKEVADIQVLLAGDGTENARAELRALVAELDLDDVVKLLASQANPERLINAADLVVLSSQAEGLPNAVLEALACGTPVVSTAVGDVEHYLPDERVVPVADPGRLAHAMLKSLLKQSGERVSHLPPNLTVDALVKSTLAALHVSGSGEYVE